MCVKTSVKFFKPYFCKQVFQIKYFEFGIGVSRPNTASIYFKHILRIFDIASNVIIYQNMDRLPHILFMLLIFAKRVQQLYHLEQYTVLVEKYHIIQNTVVMVKHSYISDGTI